MQYTINHYLAESEVCYMAFEGAVAGGGFMWHGVAAVVIVILLLIALGLVF